MKIKVYLEKLGNSKEYRDFIREYSDAYLVAGFFVLDLEANKNIHQIDFYIPSKKKIAAFTLDNHVHLQILDTMNHQIPPKLDLATNVDLDAIPGILEDEMKNRNITDEIKKIVAIIQNIGGKKIWNLNCVLSGMNILKAHIEDDSKTVLKMEKASILDYVQKLPMPPQVQGTKTPGNAKEEMKRLNELEEAIEQEKSQLQKELEKGKKPLKKSKSKDSKKD